MAPFYRGYEAKVKLDKDDITAVQALYGKRTNKVHPKPSSPGIVFPGSTRPVTGSSGDEEICTDARLDSIVTTQDGATYAFKKDQFWKLTDDSIEVGYPKYIQEYWVDLSSNIDASFTWTNGETYFLKRN